MNLTILYPGAMKPFHDGHMELLKSFIHNNDGVEPNDVILVVSMKSRAGVTAEGTEEFIRNVDFGKITNGGVSIKVQLTDRSPINVCYGICGNKENDSTYVMASSDKGDDAKRADDFYRFFSEGGRGYDEAYPDRVAKLDVTMEPVRYEERSDEFQGVPVSASVVRHDVLNGDYEAFKASYVRMLGAGMIGEEDVRAYFDRLSGEVEPSKDDEEKLNKLLQENVIDK